MAKVNLIEASELYPGDEVVVHSRSKGGTHPHKEFYGRVVDYPEGKKQSTNNRILVNNCRGKRVSLGSGTRVQLISMVTSPNCDGY